MSLLLSCMGCIVSPFIFFTDSSIITLGFLIFWGLTVIADSPLFSALVAQSALPELRGTALTIMNCIGFSITIISIQVLTVLRNIIDPKYIYMLLAFGPVLGLIALYDKNAINTFSGITKQEY